jgi:hypothetical protein
VCPVCKAGISKDKVIPLYGRGDNKQQDPREKLPPRPPGQRSEPETQVRSGLNVHYRYEDENIFYDHGWGKLGRSTFFISIDHSPKSSDIFFS